MVKDSLVFLCAVGLAVALAVCAVVEYLLVLWGKGNLVYLLLLHRCQTSVLGDAEALIFIRSQSLQL